MSDLAGTILTLAAGSLFALGGVFIQRRWQVADQSNALKAARAAEVRARMDERAVTILRLLVDLEDLLFRRLTLNPGELWPQDAAQRDPARALINRITFESNFMTQPLRRHLEQVGHLLPDAEQLVQTGWITGTSARSVGYASIRAARRSVARYLRDETVNTDYSEPLGSYVEAWNEFQDWLEHELEASAEHDGPAPAT